MWAVTREKMAEVAVIEGTQAVAYPLTVDYCGGEI